MEKTQEVADLAADIAEAFASGEGIEVVHRILADVSSLDVARILAASFAVGWRDATTWGAEVVGSDPETLMRRYVTHLRLVSMAEDLEEVSRNGR